jgi:hypothetical protein
MPSFLNLVAKRILANHTSLDHVQIVVPTRRAAFFLMQELAAETTEPLMSPGIMAIDDFVESICSLEIEDPVHLLFDLYETFREIDPDVQFDRFMGWASVLLSDLDKIDQYLVKTDFLFEYLSEAHALTRWQESLPEGKSLQGEGGSKQYFSLFENINKVYQSFRQRLLSKGKAYRGMAYRELAEDISGLTTARAEDERIYFAGFNAFTTSERTIVTALIKAGKAEVLWDSDSYYMSENTVVEAGKSLREYQRSKAFGEWNWTGEDLLSTEKHITIYGVPNATLQTKVAGELYQRMKRFDPEDSPIPTAIVLADENLLLPMLYSLDQEVRDLNVTMGLSMRNSLLYTLVDGIFELQQNVVEFRSKSGKMIRVPKFGHKSIDKILNHPFVRHYEHVALTRARRRTDDHSANAPRDHRKQPGLPELGRTDRIRRPASLVSDPFHALAEKQCAAGDPLVLSADRAVAGGLQGLQECAGNRIPLSFLHITQTIRTNDRRTDGTDHVADAQIVHVRADPADAHSVQRRADQQPANHGDARDPRPGFRADHHIVCQ